VTLLFTFLHFPATKQSLLKKMRDKRENYLLVVSETSLSQPHHGSSKPPLTTTSGGGFL